MSVTGVVYDSTGVQPVSNAMVMAVRMKDSLLLDFTRTDTAGNFSIGGFPADTFSLVIDHPQFDERIYYMFGHAENFEVNIPSVRMSTKSQELEEVIIYANREPIFYRGDTLVYVADSFKTHEGAVVEDLLKKLPGISVDKDGKITSQGQEISQVLVDGDEFFGSDPTIATKNLGADGIEQVQVYEKENEDGIGGDNEKIQVLDLRLKEDAKKGYFGRISGATDFALTPLNGATGTNPFYEGELLLNRFSGAQKISVFALGSNTPRSNFGWGDLNKFGLENESSSGNRWNPGSQGNTSGIPQTLKAGFYFSDKLGKNKNTEVGFNYSYYNDRLDANSASQSQYFLTDTSYVTDDSTRRYTSNESHRFNVNFETYIDSFTTIQIKPSLSIDRGITENTEISDFFTSSGTQTLGTIVQNDNDSKGYSVSGFAKIHRKFRKKRRELEVRYDLSHNDNETEGILDSRTTYLASTLLNDTTRQQKFNLNANTNHYGTVTYIEPLSKKLKAEFEYLYQYGFSTQDKSAFDFNTVNDDYTDFNAGFSNIFDNTRQQHRGGLRLILESGKHTVTGGVQVRNIDIDNVNKITDTTIHQNITNVLPNFRYQFKKSMSQRFSVEYRTSSAQPSINDLQPVPDNANPNRIQIGNPNIEPNYIHNVNLMFNTWKALTGRYVWAGGWFNFTDNAFADSTSYDVFGRTQTMRVNVDGNISTGVYSGAGFPFFGRLIELSPGLNASFFRNTNYILGQENQTDNYVITPSLDLDFNLLGDSLEIEFSGSYAYNNAISSLSNVATPFTTQRYSAGFDWRLPLGFGVSAEGIYNKNAQPGGGFYDTEFFIMNAEISKRFLKTQNLEVALVGNDIFNQNINARREVLGNIITDNRTVIISRYFLLKVTLRFNNRKTKEDDFNGWH